MEKKSLKVGPAVWARSALARGVRLGTIIMLAGIGVMMGCTQIISPTPQPFGQQQAMQSPPQPAPIIYPNRGQSPQREEDDKYQCYVWAKQTSAFDPVAPIQPTAPPPGPQVARGGLVEGGAVGALGGLAAGSLFGQAGKGAAIGAMAGGLIGGMMRREQMQQMAFQQEQYEKQQGAILQQKRSEYNRAFGACMSGRGYTVN